MELVGAVVFGEDFADEGEAKALSIGFGGEERGEELLGCIGRDAAAVVCDFNQCLVRGGYRSGRCIIRGTGRLMGCISGPIS